MTTEQHPLRLAVGSHQAGTGKGCAMNVISWENGDATITDMPACTDPFLARIVQRVNDSICTHRDGDLLCADCSMIVLALAHRTVGTAGHATVDTYVQIAVEEAERVLPIFEAAHPNDDRPRKAIQGAKNGTNVAYTYAAAAPAAYAAYAAYAANAAAANAADADDASADAYAAAAYAAHAASAANAAYAANAAAYAANAANDAHRIIDRFNQLTGHTEHQPNPQHTAHAIQQMLQTTH